MSVKWDKESARKHLRRVKGMSELKSILIEEEGKSSKTFKELIDLHLERAFGSDGAPIKTMTVSGKRQRTGWSRSAEDMYRMCKHYFPSVKYYEVVEYLAQHYRNHYCCNVSRMVHDAGKLSLPAPLSSTMQSKVRFLKEVENETDN